MLCRASEANKVQKFERDIEDDGTNSTTVKIIDPNSHLLQTTPAVANSMYKKKSETDKAAKDDSTMQGVTLVTLV